MIAGPAGKAIVSREGVGSRCSRAAAAVAVVVLHTGIAGLSASRSHLHSFNSMHNPPPDLPAAPPAADPLLKAAQPPRFARSHYCGGRSLAPSSGMYRSQYTYGRRTWSQGRWLRVDLAGPAVQARADRQRQQLCVELADPAAQARADRQRQQWQRCCCCGQAPWRWRRVASIRHPATPCGRAQSTGRASPRAKRCEPLLRTGATLGGQTTSNPWSTGSTKKRTRWRSEGTATATATATSAAAAGARLSMRGGATQAHVLHESVVLAPDELYNFSRAAAAAHRHRRRSV